MSTSRLTIIAAMGVATVLLSAGPAHASTAPTLTLCNKTSSAQTEQTRLILKPSGHQITWLNPGNCRSTVRNGTGIETAYVYVRAAGSTTDTNIAKISISDTTSSEIDTIGSVLLGYSALLVRN